MKGGIKIVISPGWFRGRDAGPFGFVFERAARWVQATHLIIFEPDFLQKVGPKRPQNWLRFKLRVPVSVKELGHAERRRILNSARFWKGDERGMGFVIDRGREGVVVSEGFVFESSGAGGKLEKRRALQRDPFAFPGGGFCGVGAIGRDLTRRSSEQC